MKSTREPHESAESFATRMLMGQFELEHKSEGLNQGDKLFCQQFHRGGQAA